MKKLKKYMFIRDYNGSIKVWEYIDDIKYAMTYWYVSLAIKKYGADSVMPIVMNKLGDYHTHRPDADDVIDIIEAADWPTLKLWQTYPKNVHDFKTGWVSPDGDTYTCDMYEHVDCAIAIADQLYGEQTKTICDEFLLRLGWFKCANKRYTGYIAKMSTNQAKLFLEKGFTSKLDCEIFNK